MLTLRKGYIINLCITLIGGVMSDNWDEDRQDVIGQNGNDGDHYDEEQYQRYKARLIKELRVKSYKLIDMEKKS